MKRLGFIAIFIVIGLFLSSCIKDGSTTDGENVVKDDNNTNQDSDSAENNKDSEKADGDSQEIDEGGIITECTPGEKRECYEGPSGSKNVGLCKAGEAECVVDGTDWSECLHQVTPKPEICGDGIDQDCDGSDLTAEKAIDIDNDGFTYCTGDCCETSWDCVVDPARVGPSSFEIPSNGVDDNCNGTIDEESEGCDSGLAKDSTEPLDMAKSIGLCPVSDKKGYGLVSAELLFPDETTASQVFQVNVGTAESPVNIDCGANPPNPDSYAILSKFGSVILPKEGSSFFMMSSGMADDPIPVVEARPDKTSTEFMCTRSNAPKDWYQANGNKFPSSPNCGGLTGSNDPGKEPLNDPVMLKIKVKAPNNANAFSVDIYFFSREFPEFVCQYNDFFVALLDSTFSSNDINLQNPPDKNLAKDEFKNPVGINLAKSGLFRVCCNGNMIACGYDPMNNYSAMCTQGPSELAGTGLYDSDKNGATGWLITKGNIVPGEEFTVRFAIWDALDHILDSEIIIDNFKWYESAQKPGTGEK